MNGPVRKCKAGIVVALTRIAIVEGKKMNSIENGIGDEIRNWRYWKYRMLVLRDERERDDLKVSGFHYCPGSDCLDWGGRGMELNALDLVKYRLFVPGKALTCSGSRNPLKLVSMKVLM